MNIKVTKAHGTGNDFVIIYDNNNHEKIKNPDFIQEICNRKKGIGADGLILLSDHDHYDYRMDYFNNDGGWETLCANGSRCAALLMQKNNTCSKNIRFITGDGEHKVKIKNKNSIALSMAKPHFKTDEINVSNFSGRFVDSGAKHFSTIIENITHNDVKKYGSKIRHDAQFAPDGINVNFMKIINSNHIEVFTYEKGIENMVQSCGSGSVASAFYAHSINKIKSPLKISVPGGELELVFSDAWDEVWLTGPARLSFDTKWNLK